MVDAQPQGQAQKLAPPKWLDDEGKDLFMDLEGDDNIFGDNACEVREKLLKKMAGKGEKDAADHRARVLLGLGLCEFKKGDYGISKRRLDSCVSEMNVPSDDYMLQNQQIAHIGLIKQAAGLMAKQDITQATTALRRCREILDRNLKKIIKIVHKQIPAGQAPPLDILLEEVAANGKSGQFLPMLLPQVPVLKQDLAFAEVVDSSLDALDRRIAGVEPSLKDKRLRLESKGKAGSLLYVRALPMEATVPAGQSAVAKELEASGAIKAFVEEAAAMEKGASLIKRTKPGSGCKEDKGTPKTCKALQSIGDISSNGFGETRIAVVKAGKKLQLDSCTTNANIGILVAAKDGATVKVAGADSPIELPAGEPVVVDFCREAALEAAATTPVLFAQAWHPEYAAVERTTEIRARAKSFGLSEDEVKAAVKVVNDNAKKSWEKTAKLWREDSGVHIAITKAFQQEIEDKKRKEEEAAEARRREEEAGDEERQKALDALEKKREAKRKAAQEAEEKRKRRQKQLEEERAQRDPWLNLPEVVGAEKKVEELKEARRDANAKLEFDLSTQLTKDIAAAERAYKKAVKTSRKAWKKHGGPPPASSGGDGESAGVSEAAAKGGDELKSLKAQLSDIKAKKAEAAKEENFEQAKALKKEQQAVEAKIKKLEL